MSAGHAPPAVPPPAPRPAHGYPRPSHGYLLSPQGVLFSAAVLIDTEVAILLCPSERDTVGLAIAAACLAVAHAGGYWILENRDRLKRRTWLVVQRLVPGGAELDEGLGLCDAQLREEFLEATRRERLAHDVYSAFFGGICPLKDVLLWQQGKLPDLVPGWVWVSVAVVINATHLSRVFLQQRSPAVDQTLLALTIMGHGFGQAISLTWRMPEFPNPAALFLFELMCAIVAGSVLNLRASESWAPLAASACCSFMGAYISLLVNWNGTLPWKEWFDPYCAPESVVGPVVALPLFLGVCIASTIRLWVQSVALRRFASTKHPHAY